MFYDLLDHIERRSKRSQRRPGGRDERDRRDDHRERDGWLESDDHADYRDGRSSPRRRRLSDLLDFD